MHLFHACGCAKGPWITALALEWCNESISMAVDSLRWQAVCQSPRPCRRNRTFRAWPDRLPAGGQPGTAFQVKVGGQFLTNVTEVFVPAAASRRRYGYVRPMTGMQATELRERLPASGSSRRTLPRRRRSPISGRSSSIFNSSRNISPVLAETVTLQITMAADAEPGARELRLATPQGLSNPLVFCVGQVPEFSEQESINISTPRAPISR